MGRGRMKVKQGLLIVTLAATVIAAGIPERELKGQIDRHGLEAHLTT